MGFISNLRHNRNRRKLEEAAERNPSLDSLAQLVNLYREEGNLGRARYAASRALELFPNTEVAQRLDRETGRAERSARRDHLRHQIENFPRPHDYALLAELYREDEGLDAAEEICRAGMRTFPNYGGLPYTMGLIARDRGQFEKAKEHLARAVGLESHNYKALRSLAEVCISLGRPDEARGHLEAILYFAPGDAAVQKLLKEVAGGSAAAAATTKIAPARRPRVEETQVEAIPSGTADASGKGSPLDAAVRQFRAQVPGIEGAILVDAFGLVVASDLEENLSEELAGALATNVWRSGAETASPFSLGPLQQVELEAAGGRLLVREIDEAMLALLATPEAKIGLVEMKLRELTRALRGES